MTDKKNSNKLILTFLLIIFIVGLFVRFYNYPQRISVDADSSRDASVAWSGARNLQLPLTGPFISIAPVTTGPWYWWQLIMATIIIPSKLAPWLYLGILSSGLILIAYKIGVLLESKLFGLILSLIVALAPQQITTAQWLTNPSTVGFFSSLVVLFFLKVAKGKRNLFHGVLFGLFLGIAVNIHYQSAGLITLLFFLLVLSRKNSRVFLAALLVFLLTFIPLLFFELNNHWYDTRNFLEYLRVGQYRIWTSMRWLTYFEDFWPNFWTFAIGGSRWTSLFFIMATVVLMGWRFLKKTLSKELLLLGISFFIQVIMIRYYRGEKFFGYLQFFHPFVFIFTGYVLYSFFRLKPKPLIGILVIFIYLFLVFPSVRETIFQKAGLIPESKERINYILKQTKGEKYTLYRCVGYDPNHGRALLLLSNIENRLNENSKYKIGYNFGDCALPETAETELAKIKGETVKYEELFPGSGDLINLSQASEAAILKAHWIPLNADEEYKSAARWWFKEQP